jgi:hypothetical protein
MKLVAANISWVEVLAPETLVPESSDRIDVDPWIFGSNPEPWAAFPRLRDVVY